MLIVSGVRKSFSGITLPSGDTIKDLEEQGYKYLGILQEADVKCTEMKEVVRNEYLRRLKAVARSKLYAKNLIVAVNAWAVSVIRYSAGVIDWKEKELKDMDIKTRKILTMNGIFHKKSNVDRLYLRRAEGGRGLISIEDCVKMEICGLKDYLDINPGWLTSAANEDLYRNIKVETSESEGSMSEGINSDSECDRENGSDYGVKVGRDVDEVGQSESMDYMLESAREYIERVLCERDARVWEKPMHGKFFREVAKDATPDCYEWVLKGRVNKTTEAFIFAAQEQALSTNWLRSRIIGDGGNPLCRKCGKKVETVTHLVSSCGALSQYHYRKRHDKMGLRIYWELCRKYNIKCSDKWYSETPDKVRKSECGQFEIWWDRIVETPKALKHCKPDVVVIDRARKKWTIIDFAVPIDQNVKAKEEEKCANYSELADEIRKLHKVKTSVVPLVVGALGVVTKNLKVQLKSLEIPNVHQVFACMQMSAVLGTAIILRQVLNSPN